eukprot:2423906-Amphidinium_carterae.1
MTYQHQTLAGDLAQTHYKLSGERETVLRPLRDLHFARNWDDHATSLSPAPTLCTPTWLTMPPCFTRLIMLWSSSPSSSARSTWTFVHTCSPAFSVLTCYFTMPRTSTWVTMRSKLIWVIVFFGILCPGHQLGDRA